MLDSCVLADWASSREPGIAALDIRNVLERRFEHFLLFGTMRTPVGAVHFRLLRRHAFRECIEAAPAFAQCQINYGGKGSDDQRDR